MGMNGEANLAEARQSAGGLALAEFRLAYATDAPRLAAGSFIPEKETVTWLHS